MSSDSNRSLLAAHDPPPVQVINPGGASSFLLIGDHAGNAVPAALGSLGLAQADLARHIGLDIGVAGLGESLSRALDAVFIRQTYSRLVVDCNRAPSAADVIAEVSDGTRVPGNQALSAPLREARFAAIHEPYQSAIAEELARRDRLGCASILVALHSFTPRMNGEDRPWQIGVLHDGGDPAFALIVLAALRDDRDLILGDNQPYKMDSIDYTIPRHAYPASRPYVEFEVRQDLIESPEGQAHWCATIAAALSTATSILSHR